MAGLFDLFAAGFLAGQARHEPLDRCLRMGAICAGLASANGASIHLDYKTNYPVTVNHPGLTEWSVPALARCAGETHVR